MEGITRIAIYTGIIISYIFLINFIAENLDLFYFSEYKDKYCEYKETGWQDWIPDSHGLMFGWKESDSNPGENK